jgi:hypothetical protein
MKKHIHLRFLAHCSILILTISACGSSFSPPQKKTGKEQQTEPLVATTTMVFIDNADKGEYAATIRIEKGRLKVGQRIEARKSGMHFTFEVLEIKVEDAKVNETGPVNYAFVVLRATSDANGFDSGFALGDATSVESTANATSSDETTGEATCLVDGIDWSGSGYSNSHLFYAAGMRNIFGGKPYLMLAFQSVNSPDNRQLTITLPGFTGEKGIYTGNAIEILFSGSATGNNEQSMLQGHKIPAQPTNFSVEITAYKSLADDSALISGKFNGTLKGIFGAPSVDIQNGKFRDVTVKVFRQAY